MKEKKRGRIEKRRKGDDRERELGKERRTEGREK